MRCLEQREEPPGSSLVPGHFPLTRDEFRRICAMLHEDAGIFLSDGKAALVYSRLAKRLRALGLESFKEYCALLSSAEGVDERQKMIAALTTNVTKFFREPHHFEHLKRFVVAERAAAVRKGQKMRIWSAACSDGQEPYSIAMTILSVIPEAADLDVRVLATDIDPNMIAAGRTGLYAEEAVRHVPPDMRRWFEPVTERGERRFAVAPELSSLVAFRALNLVGPWPIKGKFDAIFCRNVAIYFEEETRSAVWRRLVPALTPHGRLYLGHSERISGSASNSLQADGITTYRLRRSIEA